MAHVRVQRGKAALINPDTGVMEWVPLDQVPGLLGQGWDPETQQNIEAAAREEIYGGTSGELTAAFVGAARGATLGLSDILFRGLGTSAETLERTQQASPAASMAGEVAGLVGGALLPVGPLAGVAKAGGAVGKAATGAMRAGRLGKVGGALARGAVEGGMVGGAMGATEPFRDPEADLADMVKRLGEGALIGAGFNVAALGVGALGRWTGAHYRRLAKRLGADPEQLAVASKEAREAEKALTALELKSGVRRTTAPPSGPYRSSQVTGQQPLPTTVIDDLGGTAAATPKAKRAATPSIAKAPTDIKVPTPPPGKVPTEVRKRLEQELKDLSQQRNGLVEQLNAWRKGIGEKDFRKLLQGGGLPPKAQHLANRLDDVRLRIVDVSDQLAGKAPASPLSTAVEQLQARLEGVAGKAADAGFLGADDVRLAAKLMKQLERAQARASGARANMIRRAAEREAAYIMRRAMRQRHGFGRYGAPLAGGGIGALVSESVMGGLLGAVVAPVVMKAAHWALWNAGKAAVKAAPTIDKILLRSGTGIVDLSLNDYEDIRAEMESTTPEQIADRSTLLAPDWLDQEARSSMTQDAIQTTAYLHKTMPRAPQGEEYTWKPTPDDRQKWARRIRAAVDPESIVRDFAREQLTPEARDTVAALRPQFLDELSKWVGEQVQARRALGEKIPTRLLEQVALLTGKPEFGPAIDHPAVQVYLQQSFAQALAGGIQGSPGGGGGKFKTAERGLSRLDRALERTG